MAPNDLTPATGDEDPFKVLTQDVPSKFKLSVDKLTKSTFKPNGQLNYSDTSPAFSGQGVKRLAMGLGVSEVAQIFASAFPGEATNLARGVADAAASTMVNGELRKANARVDNDVADIYQQESIRYQDNIDAFQKRRLTGLSPNQQSYFNACLLVGEEIDPKVFTHKTHIQLNEVDHIAVLKYAKPLADAKVEEKARADKIKHLEDETKLAGGDIGNMTVAKAAEIRDTFAAKMASDRQKFDALYKPAPKDQSGRPLDVDTEKAASDLWKEMVIDYRRYNQYNIGAASANDIEGFRQLGGFPGINPWGLKKFGEGMAISLDAGTPSLQTQGAPAQTPIVSPPASQSTGPNTNHASAGQPAPPQGGNGAHDYPQLAAAVNKSLAFIQLNQSDPQMQKAVNASKAVIVANLAVGMRWQAEDLDKQDPSTRHHANDMNLDAFLVKRGISLDALPYAQAAANRADKAIDADQRTHATIDAANKPLMKQSPTPASQKPLLKANPKTGMLDDMGPPGDDVVSQGNVPGRHQPANTALPAAAMAAVQQHVTQAPALATVTSPVVNAQQIGVGMSGRTIGSAQAFLQNIKVDNVTLTQATDASPTATPLPAAAAGQART